MSCCLTASPFQIKTLAIVLPSLLAGCSLIQDPDMFVFVDDGGVDAASRDAGMCTAATDCPSRAHAIVGCEAGECVMSGCAPGFDDCNADPSDGCEADLGDPATCGECGMRCAAPAPLCDASRTHPSCVASCPPGSELCGSSCVDVTTSVLHCTACDTPCPVPEHSTPRCDNGCGFTCMDGFADCNGDAADGCEIDTSTDVDHCGGCGVQCEGMDATWTCASGTCAVAECDDGFADCNGDAADGCEIDTSTDVNHCGACGAACDGTCRDGICDPIVDVAGAQTHTCVVKLSGKLLCWGNNVVGQLGTGDRGARARPTEVTMGGSPLIVRDVTVGRYHSCAIDDSGHLLCWGRGGYGELGDNVMATRVRPDFVTSADPDFADRTFTAVESREAQTCAIDDLGGLWCWGRNHVGQTGTGDTVRTRQATKVVGLPGPVAEVALGASTTCARLQDETVRCWGHNNYGQCGASAGTDVVLTPIDVGLREIVSLGAGEDHVCAANRTGELYCWGRGAGGANGAVDEATRTAPTLLPALSGVTQVACGDRFTCVVDGMGPGCFGTRRAGALGDDRTDGFTTEPVRPAGLGTAPRIVPIYDGACAVDGPTLMCWGRNQYGQLARDESILATTPRDVLAADGTPLTGVTSLSVGDHHACVLMGGTPYCWGFGERGQLGTGELRNSSSPVTVAGLVSATYLAAGHLSSCAIVGGEGYCWGDDSFSRLGTAGTTSASFAPIEVPGGSVTEVRTGTTHGCAIDGGQIWCWGLNSSGQLGRGGAPSGHDVVENTPALVVGLNDAVQLALGYNFTCARRAGGTVQCWGAAGRLGDGTGNASTVPVTVMGVSGAIDVDAGRSHACAIAEGAIPGQGQVVCWGANGAGAIGHPSMSSNFDAPYTLPGLTDAVSVAAGEDYTCAVRAGGSALCWGANLHGQLGDGTTDPHRTPAPVRALSGATKIATGPGPESQLTCALLDSGQVSCWGNCSVGACGTGEALIRPTPGPVVGL